MAHEPKSIAELAREQGVTPMADVRDLWGTWPGEPDDGFEESIDELRGSWPTRSAGEWDEKASDLRRGRFRRSSFFLKPLKKGARDE